MVDYDEYLKNNPYLYYSATAITHKIDNYPKNEQIKKNLYLLNEKMIKPLAQKYKMNINVVYRNDRVNELVGGKKYSAHKDGRAWDANYEYDNEEKFISDVKALPAIGYFYPINKETKAWHISMSSTNSVYKDYFTQLTSTPVLTIIILAAIVVALFS